MNILYIIIGFLSLIFISLFFGMDSGLEFFLPYNEQTLLTKIIVSFLFICVYLLIGSFIAYVWLKDGDK